MAAVEAAVALDWTASWLMAAVAEGVDREAVELYPEYALLMAVATVAADCATFPLQTIMTILSVISNQDNKREQVSVGDD